MADSVVSGQTACAVCGVTDNLKRCAKCKLVRYCSREHQASDWKKHKLECGKQTTVSSPPETGKLNVVGGQSSAASGSVSADTGGAARPDTDADGRGGDDGAVGGGDGAVGGHEEAVDNAGAEAEEGIPLHAGPLRLSDFPKPLKFMEIDDVPAFCARSMKKDGFCVIDDMLSEEECSALVAEIQKVETDGLMNIGKLAGGHTGGVEANKVVNTGIRSDKIAWLEGKETDQYPTICRLIADKMDGLLIPLSAYFKGAFTLGGRTKAMVACYPSGGSHYKRHVDNPRKDGRIITCLIYANKDWDAETMGGVLRIFPESRGGDYMDVSPVMGRMLMFWSDRRTPHEVQPAYAKRYAVTMWYFDAEERAKAKNEQAEEDVAKIRREIAQVNVKTKQVEKEILQKKIDTTTTNAISMLSPGELEVLTTMVNSSPDPRAMLTGLGIASILQDSLLETIAAKTSDNKVPKGDRETEII